MNRFLIVVIIKQLSLFVKLFLRMEADKYVDLSQNCDIILDAILFFSALAMR